MRDTSPAAAHSQTFDRPAITAARPHLLFFTDRRSGHARRVEGYLAAALQRRRNHETFLLHQIDIDDRPDLVERFQITTAATLIVVANKRLCARLEQPRSIVEIQSTLRPWLQ